MKKAFWVNALVLLSLSFAQPARSEVIFTLFNVGSDVVLTASGTLDTAGLTLYPDSGSPFIRQTTTGFNLSAGAGGFDSSLVSFILQSGQLSLGNGVSFNPTVSGGTGPFVGILAAANVVMKISSSYVSGTYMSSSLTAAGVQLSDYAFTPGIYSWNIGSGLHTDKVTLYVGMVPEPGTLVLGGIGSLALIGLHWRRRSSRRTAITE